MAEIRCPMCSKPNPEENEVCQFCQARLKPLTGGQSAEETPQDRPEPKSKPTPLERPVSSPTEDLSRLRSQYEELLPDLFPSDEKEDTEGLGAPLDDAYEEPDTSQEYLGRLTTPVEETDQAPAQEIQDSADETIDESGKPVPEWLSRIRQKESERTRQEEPPSEDGDWLSRLRHKEDEDEAESLEAEPVEFESPAREELDWSEPGLPEPEIPSPEPQAFEEELRTESEEVQSTPDWFSESVSDEEEAQPHETEEDGAMPGWLAQARQEVSAESAPKDEHETPSSVSPFEAGPFDGDEIPDLSSEETPGWLTDGVDEREEQAGDEEAQSLSWLESEVDVDLQELDSGAFLKVEPEEDLELPGWLAEAVDPNRTAGAGPEGEKADQPPPAQKKPPTETPPSSETPLGPASKPFIDGTLDEVLESDSPWEEIPDQEPPAPDLDTPSQPFVVEPEEAEKEASTADEGLGLPAWLDEIREPSPVKEEPPPPEAPALTAGPGAPREPDSKGSGLTLDDLELPEWIGEMRDEVAAGEGSPELAPATLPTWLEAMRPIESFKSDKALIPEDDQSVESIGPLAGLRGVLAAEPIMAMPRTATIGGARLEVNEQQYARAELLARMIQEEQTEHAELKEKRRRIPVARLLVTLALLAALFFSLPGSGGAADNRFLAPENQPQSLNNLYELVQNAPLDRPVLVVFDYTPAYAGELETYATPILTDIVGRQLKIVTVSTHPTGPALAARLLQTVSGARELQNTRDYLHFGYLSGGPTAVQLFAANPRQALVYGFQLPGDSRLSNVWNYPIVENVSQLSDFGLLLVMTAGTDSARTWVEQAGPYLGDTPLVLILSAGVEPLLQPYSIGMEPQVDNILSGISVAYVYEGRMGLEGSARTNWDSFGSMLSVVELILIAGLVYGVVRYALNAFGMVKE